MKKTIEIKLENKTVIVEKLALGRYAEVLKKIQELPKHIPGLSGKKGNEIMQQLPYLMGVAYPDIRNILTIGTNLTADEIDELGLDEATKIVIAFYEVNNYSEVFESIKKAMARPNEK